MTEEEEFEFRHRLEQEQSLSSLVQDAPQPSFQDQVPGILKQAGQAAMASSPAKLTQSFMQTDPATMQRVGGPALPIVGGAIGGPVGAAAGEFARQATGTAFAPETVAETGLGRAASVITAGIAQQPKILGAIPGASKVGEMATKLVSKAVSKTGSGLAKVAQAFSGGKAGDFIETAKKGGSTYLAPSKQEAGKMMERAIERLPKEMEFIPPENVPVPKTVYGDESKPLLNQFGATIKKPIPPDPPWKGPFPVKSSIKETVQSAITPEAASGNKYLLDLAERLDGGELVTAKQALKAKQSLDDVIDTVPIWQTKRRAKLFDLKSTFDDVLTSQSGELKKASNAYRAAILKDNMTKFLPVNKHGEYSRLAPMLAGLASSLGGGAGGHYGGAKEGVLGALTPIAGMVALSPGMLGGAAAGIGGTARGLNAIANNPAARQVLLQLYQKLKNNSPSQGTP